MTSSDGQGHLLSLKVMRVSRPGLAAAWEPFYSSSPSFSAHSTASILSLQGTTPLQGHPKTLRDLTHVSEFLTLPAAFGAIQLGETFSCCFSVNNETHAAVDGVHIRLEMQTANTKSLLCDLGGVGHTLPAGDSLEDVVHHEVKELGQHVLACTVTYRVPPGYPYVPGPVDGADDPSLQSFRKFYKFSVTNPLSVKTKVHAPKSPSALLDPCERDKVFLEVHIQNMTQETVWFDRMEFECAEGWRASDANCLPSADPSGDGTQPLFSGSMALMQPQAIRQYIYILSPTDVPTFPVTYSPGSVVPLGRLDIAWRSKFGEPGRLLTSMLSRRIPGPQQAPAVPPIPSQPPSAIPPYLQRAPQGIPSSPSRPRSPQLPVSRPNSPPPGAFRSNSPFRPASRPQPGTPIPGSRPLSPAPSTTSVQGIQLQPLIIPESPPDLDVDLVIVRRSGDVRVGKPFSLTLRLGAAATIPQGRRRQVRFVVQHLVPRRVPPHTQSASETAVASGPAPSRLLSHAPMVTSAAQTPVEQTPVSLFQRLVPAEGDSMLLLPPPYFETADETRDVKLRGCSFLGPSAIPLDVIELAQQDVLPSDPPRVEASQTFELTFLPVRTGFLCVGGLRLILVDDHLSDGDTEPSTHVPTKGPRTLKELDIIAEIWVQS